MQELTDPLYIHFENVYSKAQGIRPIQLDEIYSSLNHFDDLIIRFKNSNSDDVNAKVEKLLQLNTATKFYLKAL